MKRQRRFLEVFNVSCNLVSSICERELLLLAFFVEIYVEIRIIFGIFVG